MLRSRWLSLATLSALAVMVHLPSAQAVEPAPGGIDVTVVDQQFAQKAGLSESQAQAFRTPSAADVAGLPRQPDALAQAVISLESGTYYYTLSDGVGDEAHAQLQFLAPGKVPVVADYSSRNDGDDVVWNMQVQGQDVASSGRAASAAAACEECGAYSTAGGVVGGTAGAVCGVGIAGAGLTFGVSALACTGIVLGPVLGLIGQTACQDRGCPTPANYAASAPPTFSLNGASCSFSDCTFVISTNNNGRAVSSIYSQVYWQGAVNPNKYFKTNEIRGHSTRPLLNSQYQLQHAALDRITASCTVQTSSYINVFWSDGSTQHFNAPLVLAKPAQTC